MTANWRDYARCAEVDPELFFAEGRGVSPRAARRVCASCEVQPQCLAYALAHPELEGVWGGLTEKERREPRRQMRAAA